MSASHWDCNDIGWHNSTNAFGTSHFHCTETNGKDVELKCAFIFSSELSLVFTYSTVDFQITIQDLSWI